VIRQPCAAQPVEQIRDVRVSPYGAVYLVTDGNPGRIVRVDPD
jgi:glucose/arabinose dehydrogenase